MVPLDITVLGTAELLGADRRYLKEAQKADRMSQTQGTFVISSDLRLETGETKL